MEFTEFSQIPMKEVFIAAWIHLNLGFKGKCRIDLGFNTAHRTVSEDKRQLFEQEPWSCGTYTRKEMAKCEETLSSDQL